MLKSGIKAFSYQKESLVHCLKTKKSLISLPTGAGKTLIPLVYFSKLRDAGRLEKCIWVTIPSITHQVQETKDDLMDEDYPLLIVDVNKLSKKKRETVYGDCDFDVLVINYEKLRFDKNYLERITTNYECMVVFDESVKIKNPSTKSSKIASNLSTYSSRVVAMTATPIMKNLEDLSNMLRVTGVYEFNPKIFKKTFCITERIRIKPVKRYGKMISHADVVIGYKNIPLFFEKIANYTIFKKKSDIGEMPPNNLITLNIKQNKETKEALEKIKEEYDTVPQALVDLAENYPAVILEKKTTVPNKLEEIAHYITENCDNKVLIYTKYKKSIPYIGKVLEKYYKIKSMYMYGGVDGKHLKDTFLSSSDIKVLIGNDAISEGFDGLQKQIDTVVFADIPQTFGKYQQIIGRISRAGVNFEHLNIIVPIIEKSIDHIKWVNLNSMAMLLLKNNPDQIEEGTYDTRVVGKLSDLCDEEWVKKRLYDQYNADIGGHNE